jgi:hypothetical protein
MKLVIQTQNKENYAAHDNDYVHGVSEDYWKFKGGDTFIVEDLTNSICFTEKLHASAAYAIVDEIKELICYSNEYFEAYVIDWEIAGDDAIVCEKWETPVVLSKVDDKWIATKVSDNRDDLGWRRKEILEVTETWECAPHDERKNYNSSYLMEDGVTVSYNGLTKWFEDQKEVA